MLQNRPPVRAWDHAHAPILLIRTVNGQPGCDRKRRFQSPVGHVLMPSHKLILSLRIFAKEMRCQQENIMSQKKLDMLQNFRMSSQLPYELHIKVAIDQSDLGFSFSFLYFQLVKEPSVILNLRRRQNI